MAKEEEERLPDPDELPVTIQIKVSKAIQRNIQIRAALGKLTFNQIVEKALERDAMRFPDLIKEVEALAEKIQKSE